MSNSGVFKLIPTAKKAEHMAKDAEQPNQRISDAMCDREQEGIRSTRGDNGPFQALIGRGHFGQPVEHCNVFLND
jgi:hypothetical protein